MEKIASPHQADCCKVCDRPDSFPRFPERPAAACSMLWGNHVNTFETLEVWQRSMQLAERVYQVTDTFPRSELFGVTSQLRRAAVSIASNVAEGHCRRTTKAYINHVSIALGSNGEVATLLHLSARLGYLTPEQARSLGGLNEVVAKLLYGLHRSLSATTPRT